LPTQLNEDETVLTASNLIIIVLGAELAEGIAGEFGPGTS
jgi:hypothetical protein